MAVIRISGAPDAHLALSSVLMMQKQPCPQTIVYFVLYAAAKRTFNS
jgi:hypothetical protein